MRTIAVRLRPGADLKGELVALAARERVRAGWVLTCVGSLSHVRVWLAGGAEHASWEGAFEIVAPHRHPVPGRRPPAPGGRRPARPHRRRPPRRGCTVRTTAEVVVAADDRLLFAREH